MVDVNEIRALDKIAVAFPRVVGLAYGRPRTSLYPRQNVQRVSPERVRNLREGSLKGSINKMSRKASFTRGILMDIPRLEGVEYLEPGTPIYVEDLEAWEKKTCVRCQPETLCLSAPGDGRDAPNWDRLIRILERDSTPP